MNLEVTSRGLRVALIAGAALGLGTTGCGTSANAALPVGDDASTVGDDSGDPGAFIGVAEAGDPLQARIQVNGPHTTCGTCSVLVAQVQGGVPPYSYAWSDPAFQGMASHEVCPTMPTRYTLTVTDSSGKSSGEITMPAQKVQVSASVDCVAPSTDAGTPAGALDGCRLTTTQHAEATDGGMGLDCPANVTSSGLEAVIDGGVEASHAGQLPGRLLAGHAYSFAYDRVLPLSVGQPVTVDVYGSNAPDICTEGEKLFTMNLDGSLPAWDKTYCFTPAKDYSYIISNVSIQGVFFYNSVDFSGTLCTDCPAQGQ
jgi:hypothetical protein